MTHVMQNLIKQALLEGSEMVSCKVTVIMWFLDDCEGQSSESYTFPQGGNLQLCFETKAPSLPPWGGLSHTSLSPASVDPTVPSLPRYDKKLLIFDTYQTPGRKGLTTKHCIPRAHRAAITHLLLVRQQETTRYKLSAKGRPPRPWDRDNGLCG